MKLGLDVRIKGTETLNIQPNCQLVGKFVAMIETIFNRVYNVSIKSAEVWVVRYEVKGVFRTVEYSMSIGLVRMKVSYEKVSSY